MRTTSLCALAAGILLTVTGCHTGPDVVRGQTPNEMPLYASPGEGTMTPNSPYSFAAPGAEMGDACPPGYGGGGGGGGGYAMREWNRSCYCVPNNLVYPPANQMPAVVQYPYYTVKGPSCFFYTGE